MWSNILHEDGLISIWFIFSYSWLFWFFVKFLIFSVIFSVLFNLKYWRIWMSSHQKVSLIEIIVDLKLNDPDIPIENILFQYRCKHGIDAKNFVEKTSWKVPKYIFKK